MNRLIVSTTCLYSIKLRPNPAIVGWVVTMTERKCLLTLILGSSSWYKGYKIDSWIGRESKGTIYLREGYQNELYPASIREGDSRQVANLTTYWAIFSWNKRMITLTSYAGFTETPTKVLEVWEGIYWIGTLLFSSFTEIQKRVIVSNMHFLIF